MIRRLITMAERNDYNMQFRPPDYFDISDLDNRLLSPIKGEKRRQIVRKLLEGNTPEDLDHLDGRTLKMLRDSLFDEDLSEQEREAIGMMHPMFMGGEFLPSSGEDEVEIARVSLESTTADVISIRARSEGQKILYRIVDEYESEFRFEPRKSDLPLTMGELITLIDQTETTDYAGEDDYGNGLTDSFRNMNLTDGQDSTDLIDFVTVSSEFYPTLQGYYRDRAIEWAERIEASRAQAD
jgi:hypothetical protein